MDTHIPEEMWKSHCERLKDIPPRGTLVRAVPFVLKRNNALDLGPGALSDTKYLLSQNFGHVTAVDSTDIRTFVDEIGNNKLAFVQSTFEDFSFPEGKYDLVNAQFSLPFNPKETFTSVFEKIKKSLVLGGIFTGTFFGKKDSWNIAQSSLTFHNKEEVESLLADMEVIECKEREWDGTITTGEKKHWHMYSVIVRKNPRI